MELRRIIDTTQTLQLRQLITEYLLQGEYLQAAADKDRDDGQALRQSHFQLPHCPYREQHDENIGKYIQAGLHEVVDRPIDACRCGQPGKSQVPARGNWDAREGDEPNCDSYIGGDECQGGVHHDPKRPHLRKSQVEHENRTL